VPVESIDLVNDEEHTSLAEILGMIKDSPTTHQAPGYQPSRLLNRPNKVPGNCLLLRILGLKQVLPAYGRMEKRKGPRRLFSPKLLAIRTYRKILKMQESLFKYGTFVPRNDREAEISPEAVQWKSGR
jgi:hypothetical protein